MMHNDKTEDPPLELFQPCENGYWYSASKTEHHMNDDYSRLLLWSLTFVVNYNSESQKGVGESLQLRPAVIAWKWYKMFMSWAIK
jgi:hypothetical protein